MTLLSIIVPVYNEEGNVEPLYDAVNRALQPIADNHSWEFVFTDNCSTDRTFECLERLAARDPRVRAYRFTRNFGFQRSILTGYRLARGDAAVQIDCDLQDLPSSSATLSNSGRRATRSSTGYAGRGRSHFIFAQRGACSIDSSPG